MSCTAVLANRFEFAFQLSLKEDMASQSVRVWLLFPSAKIGTNILEELCTYRFTAGLNVKFSSWRCYLKCLKGKLKQCAC